MASKHKVTRHRQPSVKDREEMRKFLTIVAIATVLLMLLMYFIFAG
jgi:hypothetical protein